MGQDSASQFRSCRGKSRGLQRLRRAPRLGCPLSSSHFRFGETEAQRWPLVWTVRIRTDSRVTPPSQTSARPRPPMSQHPGSLHRPIRSTCTLRTEGSSRIPRRVESNWPWRPCCPEANRGFLLLSWGQNAASTAAAETQIPSPHLAFAASPLRLPVLCRSPPLPPSWVGSWNHMLAPATKGRLNLQPTPPTCCDFGRDTEPR